MMTDQPAMDEFTYLSVLIGLILGLGITQLMEGFGRLLQLRDRMIRYWPVKLWGGVLLMFHIQAWWAMYELRHIPHWTFPSFIMVLIQPVLLFLLSALALPDSREDHPIDLKTAFIGHAPFTFIVATLMVLSSLLKEYWLYHRLPHGQNLGFHGLFVLLFITGSLIPTERCYRLVITGSALILVVYISSLFLRLD
jgi:hypothetical protein